MGAHVANVIRALPLQSQGYQVTGHRADRLGAFAE
jgi:hypothetical protein